MGVLDCIAEFDKEFEAGAKIEGMLAHIIAEFLPINILHREVG